MSVRFPTRSETDAALHGAMDDLRRLVTETRPYSPLDAKYRIGKTLVFAMVQHRTNATGSALLLSLDGDWHNAKWFPRRGLTIYASQREERFKVIKISGRLANEKEMPTQPARPQLSPAISWTDAQLAEWLHVSERRVAISDAVKRSAPGYRKPPQRMPFGMTA